MRIRYLIRYFITWLLIFVTQKVVFMLVNMGLADEAPFWSCIAVLWHGLRLDITTACYLSIVPTLVVLVSYFFRQFPLRKVLLPYYWLTAVLIAVAFLADTILYFFWGAKLDANELMYVAKPKDMLASLPVWQAVAAFILMGAVAYHYFRRQRHATPAQLAAPGSRFGALLILPLAGLIFLGMRGGVTQSTANPSYAYFSSHQFCNHAALNPAFNIFHSMFKVQDLEKEFDRFSEPELESIMGDSYAPDPSLADTLLSVQRPNVLLVIWEGAGMAMVGSDSVAPCLQALRKEGIWFSNCYANSFRTDRGILSVLSGWPGMPTLSLIKRTNICRNLPSLASSLRSEGYATSLTYGGDVDYANMRLYFSETGFSTIRGSHYFPASQNTSAWGVHDHFLLQPEVLIPNERPFFSTALTLSSHEPWEVPMQRLRHPRWNSFAYTDSCLGAFIDQLKAMPLWDSLLVVILPDHGITYPGVHSTADLRVSHIPILWVGGALAKYGECDRLMNQSDLAATLLAQLGVDAAAFHFSRNVFGRSFGRRHQFALHADKNGVTLIEPEGSWVYDCVSRTLQPDSDAHLRFVEASLQQLYQTTAALPRLAREQQ